MPGHVSRRWVCLKMATQKSTGWTAGSSSDHFLAMQGLGKYHFWTNRTNSFNYKYYKYFWTAMLIIQFISGFGHFSLQPRASLMVYVFNPSQQNWYCQLGYVAIPSTSLIGFGCMPACHQKMLGWFACHASWMETNNANERDSATFTSFQCCD